MAVLALAGLVYLGVCLVSVPLVPSQVRGRIEPGLYTFTSDGSDNNTFFSSSVCTNVCMNGSKVFNFQTVMTYDAPVLMFTSLPEIPFYSVVLQVFYQKGVANVPLVHLTMCPKYLGV